MKMAKHPMVRIHSENFDTKTIPANSTLDTFCAEHNINKQGVFLELNEIEAIDSILYVMLLDKVTAILC